MATYSSRIEPDEPAPVEVFNPAGRSALLLVCEHASNYIPARYQGLGLAADAVKSHAAWDPGALAVAKELSNIFDARLVAGTVSRLVYDCNRPPESPAAILAKSELVDVPGNAGLTDTQKRERVERVYLPFQTRLAEEIARSGGNGPVLVTVHSFTPVYMNRRREVEIGILHDEDSRLADTMLGAMDGHRAHQIERNQPYGPADGVTHTLKRHGLKNGIQNVMIEIANNLIARRSDQKAMAGLLAGWLKEALDALEISVVTKGEACRA